MNPPYGPMTNEWLKKLSSHNNGIALIFARTETAMFFEWIWPKASALLFIEGRLFFHDHSGQRAKNNSGGPSVLVAYDHPTNDLNSKILANSGIKGQFIDMCKQRLP